MAATIIFLLLLFSTAVNSYTDYAINLLVRSPSNTRRYCVELAKLPNNHTVNITGFGWYTPFIASSSVNACNITDLSTTFPSGFDPRTILILYEHQCKMTEHAWNVEQQFGKEIS